MSVSGFMSIANGSSAGLVSSARHSLALIIKPLGVQRMVEADLVLVAECVKYEMREIEM